MSGFSRRVDARALEDALVRGQVARTCAVAGDAAGPLECLRSPPLPPGSNDDVIILIAGTGSAAFRYPPRDVQRPAALFRNTSAWRSRAGGRGHLLGDHGSAYWIGRAALEALLLQEDGISVPPFHEEKNDGLAWLRAAALKAYGVSTVPELVAAVHGGADPAASKSRVASFAATVAVGAAAGDAACAELMGRAGLWLGRMLQAVLRQSGNVDGSSGSGGGGDAAAATTITVLLVGSVWRSWSLPVFRSQFEAGANGQTGGPADRRTIQLFRVRPDCSCADGCLLVAADLLDAVPGPLPEPVVEAIGTLVLYAC